MKQFLIDGNLCTIEEALHDNTDDKVVCAWLQSAQVGDSFLGHAGSEVAKRMPDVVDKPYIGVTQGRAGWFAVLYSADAEGEYEPEQTGVGRFATRDEAVEEAETWADNEERELRI